MISFLRQIVEHGGFYRTTDQTWIKLERIQFVGACNPPTDPGRKPLSHRYHMCHVCHMYHVSRLLTCIIIISQYHMMHKCMQWCYLLLKASKLANITY